MTNEPNMMRAWLAITLRGQDVAHADATGDQAFIPGTYDAYLGLAQMILEASYRNFRHPAQAMVSSESTSPSVQP